MEPYSVKRRIAWIAPRRALNIVSCLSTQIFIVMALLYSDALTLKSYECFSNCEHTIIEVPPMRGSHLKCQVNQLVDRIAAHCPKITVIAQPSYRPCTDRSEWLSEWNGDKDMCFRFHQTCSCKCGATARTAGCHLRYYVGSTDPSLQVAACAEVPMAQPSQTILTQGLEDVLSFVLGGVSLPTNHSPSSDPLRTSSRRAQRVPDSFKSSSSSHVSASLQVSQAYPTDAKEREKAKKKRLQELGVEVTVKKRQKVCQDHYDDCGDDISSLKLPADDDTNDIFWSPLTDSEMLLCD